MRMLDSFLALIILSELLGCQPAQNANNPPSAIPSTTTASPSVRAVSGLEQLSRVGSLPNSGKLFCATVESSLKPPNLDQLADFSVSLDGKVVYYLGRRFLSRDCSEAPDCIVSRQFVYQISEQGNVTPVSSKGQYPFSCVLGEEIEKDAQGNLFVTASILDQSVPFHQPLGYRFIAIDVRQQSFSEVAKFDIKLPEPSPSALPDARNLKNLYIRQGEDNPKSVYFALLSLSESGSNFVKKFNLNSSQSEDLLVFGSSAGVPLFAALRDDTLIHDVRRVFPPFPAPGPSAGTFFNQQWVALFPDAANRAMTHLRMDDARQTLYFSDQNRHSVWKVHLPSSTLSRLAGNDRPGYLDGQGEQAQFNNPGVIDLDAQGNLFVADLNNRAIRKITPEGKVSTFFSQTNTALTIH